MAKNANNNPFKESPYPNNPYQYAKEVTVGKKDSLIGRWRRPPHWGPEVIDENVQEESTRIRREKYI